MLFICNPKILHKHCLQFLLGIKMAPKETENNAYAKFWGDKQRALWYVMVFSGVANCKGRNRCKMHGCQSIGRFRVPPGLCIKARLSAQTLI